MKIFDYDGPLMAVIRKLLAILGAGALFLLTSLPVFTAGAAFSALYGTVERNLKNDRGYVARGFFEGWKQNWRQALPAGAVCAAALLFFEADVRIMKVILAGGHAIGNMYVLFRVFQVLLVLYAVWVLTQIAVFDNTLRQILKNALLLMIRHLGASLAVLLLIAFGAAVVWVMPIAVLFMPVVVTWLVSGVLGKVYASYMN